MANEKGKMKNGEREGGVLFPVCRQNSLLSLRSPVQIFVLFVCFVVLRPATHHVSASGELLPPSRGYKKTRSWKAPQTRTRQDASSTLITHNSLDFLC
jgi:hypothetical protein